MEKKNETKNTEKSDLHFAFSLLKEYGINSPNNIEKLEFNKGVDFKSNFWEKNIGHYYSEELCFNFFWLKSQSPCFKRLSSNFLNGFTFCDFKTISFLREIISEEKSSTREELEEVFNRDNEERIKIQKENILFTIKDLNNKRIINSGLLLSGKEDLDEHEKGKVNSYYTKNFHKSKKKADFSPQFIDFALYNLIENFSNLDSQINNLWQKWIESKKEKELIKNVNKLVEDNSKKSHEKKIIVTKSIILIFIIVTIMITIPFLFTEKIVKIKKKLKQRLNKKNM